MAQSVTLSSAGTATMVLNPVAKSTTLILSVSSNSTGYVQVDASLDDPTILNGPTATWATVSSAAAMSSSLVFTTPLVYTILSPIAAVRLYSSGVNTATLQLHALQSITA